MPEKTDSPLPPHPATPPARSGRRKAKPLNYKNYKSWPAHRPLVERIHRITPVRTGVPVYHPEQLEPPRFLERIIGKRWSNPPARLPGPTEPLEQLSRVMTGAVPHLVAYTALVPWVTRMALMCESAATEKNDPELAALTAYFQNREAGCRYGFGLAVAALRNGGWNSIRLSGLTKAKSGVMTPLQHSAVRYAVKAERGLGVSVSSGQFKRHGASDGLAEALLSEPFFQCIRIRLALGLGLPPELEIEEAAEEGRSVNRRIFGRFLGRGATAPNRQMRRTVAAYETAPGAFAALVDTAFPGKAGRRMHTMLSEAFASPVFEVRTKALMLCAAGRGLENEYIELAGREMIAADDLPQGIIDELLDRRFTEGLGEIENAVCEFVRLSICPEADVFYNKAETLRAVLTEMEMIELAGFTALLNGMGRMIRYGRKESKALSPMIKT